MLEGRLIGVFGTDAGAKAGLLGPLTKRSEAEGIVVHRRVESGMNYSFLDDAHFPEKVQGYSRIASIAYGGKAVARSVRCTPGLYEGSTLPNAVEGLPSRKSPTSCPGAW
jgi:hypothetical protein